MTIVAGPWAPGVVGLVAGRLADQLGRPAVVFSTHRRSMARLGAERGRLRPRRGVRRERVAVRALRRPCGGRRLPSRPSPLRGVPGRDGRRLGEAPRRARSATDARARPRHQRRFRGSRTLRRVDAPRRCRGRTAVAGHRRVVRGARSRRERRAHPDDAAQRGGSARRHLLRPLRSGGLDAAKGTSWMSRHDCRAAASAAWRRSSWTSGTWRRQGILRRCIGRSRAPLTTRPARSGPSTPWASPHRERSRAGSARLERMATGRHATAIVVGSGTRRLARAAAAPGRWSMARSRHRPVASHGQQRMGRRARWPGPAPGWAAARAARSPSKLAAAPRAAHRAARSHPRGRWQRLRRGEARPRRQRQRGRDGHARSDR